MKYAIFTFDGYGLPIAWHLLNKGHEVHVGVVQEAKDTRTSLESSLPPESGEERDRRLSLYDGMLDKVPAEQLIERLKKVKNRDEWFLFFDLNHLFNFTQELCLLGFRGNFPTEDDYLLEIDRELAKAYVAEHYPQVRVAPVKRFNRAAEAKKFLKDTEELWVLKGLAEDARTVVPDVEDVGLAAGQILDALAQNPDEYENAGYLLELMIPNVMELTPQCIFYDGKPISYVMCIENKQIGSGNIGPMTDCAHDFCYTTDPDEKINQIAFPPIVHERAATHRGLFYWDASLLIDSRTGRIYFGEFCANRPGYNSIYTEMTLAGSSHKYFDSLANGKNPLPANQVAISSRIFNLQHDDSGEAKSGLAVNYNPKIEDNLWLFDVTKRRNKLVCAGYRDCVGVVTGVGHSVGEAARRLHRGIDQFSFEGAYYRPQFDLVSREYKDSIVNRLNYALQRGLTRVGFGID